MNPKHHFTAILFFAILFLSCLSVKSQNSADTIRIVEDEIDIDYFLNQKRLSYKLLMDLTKENRAAYKIIDEAYSLHKMSIFFDCAGGLLVGYAAGYAIGKAIVGNIFNLKVFLPILGTGIALTSIGIGFEAGATKKAKKGVAVYNQSIKQKNNANLNLGFYPNGMALKMNF
jgi:hypothetical protein